MLARLKSLLPQSWFSSDETPVLDGVLAGFSSVAQHAKGLLTYTQAQTRISTASDGFLDLAAYDFFGLRIRRRSGQTDTSFRSLIIAEITRERVTRRGIAKAVEDLSGRPVVMFEPFNAFDCGGFDTGYLGFNDVGALGSLILPRQVFVRVVQPIGAGIPGVGGLDVGLGGLDTAPGELGDQTMVTGPVTDQDIYDTINATRAAGITAWVAIGDPPVTPSHLDADFIVGMSQLA